MNRRQWFVSLFAPVFVKLGWTKQKVTPVLYLRVVETIGDTIIYSAEFGE